MRALIEQLEPRALLTIATAYEALEMNLINRARQNPAAERARLGLAMPAGISDGPRPLLKWNGTQADVEEAWRVSCVANNMFGHDGLGTTPVTRAMSANPNVVYVLQDGALIGPIWGGDETMTAYTSYVFDRWVTSDGHFAQMVDGGTREIGIDIAIDTCNGQPCFWAFAGFITERPTMADSNGDGVVDTEDFDALARNFNQPANAPSLPAYGVTPEWPWERGDFNADGRVNALDFSALANDFGR